MARSLDMRACLSLVAIALVAPGALAEESPQHRISAKPIDRSPPRYPGHELRRNQQGWAVRDSCDDVTVVADPGSDSIRHFLAHSECRVFVLRESRNAVNQAHVNPLIEQATIWPVVSAIEHAVGQGSTCKLCCIALVEKPSYSQRASTTTTTLSGRTVSVIPT